MVTTDHTRAAAPPPSWADPAVRPPRPRDVVPLLAWAGCLAAAIVLLAALGGGRLAAPTLTAPSTWGDWAAGRDPVEVVMVVVRLLGLGLAWYLVGVTSVSVLARLCRAARLVRLADALSFGPVRTLVQQALGVGLATGVVLAAVPTTWSAPDTVVTMAPLAEVPASRAGSPPVVLPVAAESVAPGAPATHPPVPAPEAQPAATPSTAPPPAPAAVPPAPLAQSSTVEAREVTVRPGDHFWALAEDAVAAHLGRAGTEAEVARHWRALVAANADRLAVPGNADLLLPGQVVVVPSPASGGRP